QKDRIKLTAQTATSLSKLPLVHSKDGGLLDGTTMEGEAAAVVDDLVSSSDFPSVNASCSCKAYSKFHKTSPIVGLSTPYSAKHFSAASANFFIDSGLMAPTRWGSMIFSSLAHKVSSRTTPNEYTSDFSVNCCLLKYSGSKYPKLPFTAVLT
ncbi:hypothetical protein QQP08_008778, partial [Theobroma cacao]